MELSSVAGPDQGGLAMKCPRCHNTGEGALCIHCGERLDDALTGLEPVAELAHAAEKGDTFNDFPRLDPDDVAEQELALGDFERRLEAQIVAVTAAQEARAQAQLARRDGTDPYTSDPDLPMPRPTRPTDFDNAEEYEMSIKHDPLIASQDMDRQDDSLIPISNNPVAAYDAPEVDHDPYDMLLGQVTDAVEQNKVEAADLLREPEDLSFEDSPKGFQMGDISEPGQTDEGFFFGDESQPGLGDDFSFDHEDPSLPEDKRMRLEEPKPTFWDKLKPLLAAAQDRGANIKDNAGELVERVRGLKHASKAEKKRAGAVALIALLALVGLIYALSGGEAEVQDGDSDASAVAIAEEAPQSPEVAADQASYELVRLTTDDESEPPMAAIEEMPEPAKPSLPGRVGEPRPYREQNLLASGAGSESFTLQRSCILREGPASRFGLIAPLDPGHKLTVLTKSSEDWETVFRGNQVGWAKGCTAADCPLRTGPGEHFRGLQDDDKTPKPKSRVVSSSRWRYVQSGDHFGWVGPACFK